MNKKNKIKNLKNKNSKNRTETVGRPLPPKWGVWGEVGCNFTAQGLFVLLLLSCTALWPTSILLLIRWLSLLLLLPV